MGRDPTEAMKWLALMAGLVAVPVVDQYVKRVMRRWLGAGVLPLGVLGRLWIVERRVWLIRWGGCRRGAAMWGLWVFSAAMLTMSVAHVPACAGFAGLLLGGSLSHALETSLRGNVTDYVCLRFWPAFNLADVAISVGAIGFGVVMLLAVLRHA
jgi:signal peptidase II